MLGNATEFPLNNPRLPEAVEQGCFSVVDVSHDGHDRRARLKVCLLVYVKSDKEIRGIK